MNNNEQEINNKPKKRFNIFDWYYKRGKANEKADINALKTPSVVNFFKLAWFKFNKLLTANIIFAFGNFPIVFLLIAISGMFDKYSYAPVSLSWGPFQATLANTENYASSALVGIHGLHNTTQVYSIATIILFALSLFTIFTWGFTKVGTTYIYRNIMSGDPVFPLSDFFYIIKRNVKQSLIIGALDFIILAFLLYDIVFLFRNSDNTFNLIMMFLTAAMLLFYFFIRPYIYIMIFTFDLSIGKIIKNACSFAILGIKRNLMALVGCGILLAFNVGLAIIFAPIGIILPFIITIALFDFIGVYAAYPNIIKYMMNEEDARRIVERLPESDDETDAELEIMPETNEDLGEQI